MSEAVPAIASANVIRAYYARFGLEPDAPMSDVEAAYWRLARELRGQSAMSPFNEAYEALVARGKPQPTGPEPAKSAPVQEQEAEPERPASKFGWPSN